MNTNPPWSGPTRWRRRAAACGALLSLATVGWPVAAGPAEPAATEPATVAALADLGLALLRQSAPGNAVVSPLATAVALGMVHAGTAGPTEREIEALFGPGKAGAMAWRQGLPALHKQLQGGAPALAMASRMWVESSAAPGLSAGYARRLATRFGADAARLSFEDSEAARGQINRWTAEHSAGRIAELLPAGGVTPATQLVLTTAVYFRSPWEKPFDAERTAPLPFASAPGLSHDVPTLRDLRSVAQAQVDGARVLELPFAQSAFALLLAVPDDGRSLEQLQLSFTGSALARWRSALQSTRCELALPKFDIQPQSASLKPALQGLGVKTVFSASANLRPMLGRQAHNLHLDDVHHAAGITVDEQGGEAVAAAAATVRAKSFAVPAPACAVDRAFLFAVIHRATGTPLFVGRVTEPVAKP